jgi:hypothetical protein
MDIKTAVFRGVSKAKSVATSVVKLVVMEDISMVKLTKEGPKVMVEAAE